MYVPVCVKQINSRPLHLFPLCWSWSCFHSDRHHHFTPPPPPMAEGMEKSLPWGVNIVCTPPPPSPTTQSPPPSSPAFNEPHPINLPIKYKCNVSLDGCPPNAMTYLQLCTTAPWIIHPDWHVDVGVPLADCPPPLPILHPPVFS